MTSTIYSGIFKNQGGFFRLSDVISCATLLADSEYYVYTLSGPIDLKYLKLIFNLYHFDLPLPSWRPPL